MSQMPITAIEVGDIVTTGYGTLNIVDHEVSEVESDYTYGCVITIRCVDGYKFSGVPNGFWHSVKKANVQDQVKMEQFASAYARAWDRAGRG